MRRGGIRPRRPPAQIALDRNIAGTGYQHGNIDQRCRPPQNNARIRRPTRMTDQDHAGGIVVLPEGRNSRCDTVYFRISYKSFRP